MEKKPKMSQGAVLLRAWRGARSQEKAARALGMRQGQIWNYENGMRIPSLRMAFLVEELTGEAVPAQSWLEEPKG